MKSLDSYAEGIHGLGTKDAPMFIRYIWEKNCRTPEWEFMQSSINTENYWAGMDSMIYWENGSGELHKRAETGMAILAGCVGS